MCEECRALSAQVIKENEADFVREREWGSRVGVHTVRSLFQILPGYQSRTTQRWTPDFVLDEETWLRIGLIHRARGTETSSEPENLPPHP